MVVVCCCGWVSLALWLSFGFMRQLWSLIKRQVARFGQNSHIFVVQNCTQVLQGFIATISILCLVHFQHNSTGWELWILQSWIEEGQNPLAPMPRLVFYYVLLMQKCPSLIIGLPYLGLNVMRHETCCLQNLWCIHCWNSFQSLLWPKGTKECANISHIGAV